MPGLANARVAHRELLDDEGTKMARFIVGRVAGTAANSKRLHNRIVARLIKERDGVPALVVS